MKTLVFGCGYLGRRFATSWNDKGNTVYAVTRSQSNVDDFRDLGFEPIVADVTDPATLNNLPNAELVLFAVGFDRTTGHSISDVYVDGLKNVLSALPNTVKRLIYISSTGVYAQTDGEWVDESSPAQPTRDGGVACLNAEELINRSRFASQSISLRLAGIYGPGRVPRKEPILAGEPIPAAPDGYLNLIHVDDAVQVVSAAAVADEVSPLYLVSDGNPPVRGDYYRELARLYDAPEPKFSVPAADSHVAKRAASNKRISNRKLMSELPLTLKFPSYKEGLAAITNG